MRVTCATKLRWTAYESSVLCLISVYDPEVSSSDALRTAKYLEEAYAVYDRIVRGEIYSAEWLYIKTFSAVLPCG